MSDDNKQQNRSNVSIKDYFKIKSLKEKLTLANENNTILLEKLSTAELKNLNLSQQCGKLTVNVDNCLMENKEIRSESEKLAWKNQMYATTLSEQSEEIEKLTKEVDCFLVENKELERKNQRLIQELTDHKRENSKLSEEVEKLKNQVKVLQQENEKLESNRLVKEEETVRLETLVTNLTYETSALVSNLETAKNQNGFLESENRKYKAVLTNDHKMALDIKDYLSELRREVSARIAETTELESKIKKLNEEIVVLEDEILYQSFGIYTPLYEFAGSEDYKNELSEVRRKQKEMLKENTAAECNTTWRVNNSLAMGKKMVHDNIKQILRSFNAECENLIDKVKFNNLKSIEKRITKAYESLNALNESNEIKIQQKYLELKYQELWLAYEYQWKKQDEKEEMRMLREQRKEEAKLLKEIEERRKEIEKERQHYNNALNKLNDQIEREKSEVKLEFLLDRKDEIKGYLIHLDEAMKEVDYREANHRAGYVYIISNIGSFGENVYKIGMTRRLDPQDRIDELGSASVPFKFDVHAMIFSDDAPRLESLLHRAFENRKVNTINSRKEFFKVTLEEIEKVIKANHDKTVEFIKTPEAQQYRETLMKIRENSSGIA